MLAGLRVLVTGAAGGIGRATAGALAAEGARVAHADRIPPEGVDGPALGGDVSVEAEAHRLVGEAVAALGGLDLLVNNAGVLVEQPLVETSAETFDRVIGVNLRGVFLMGREAVRAMPGQGRIVNVASELGILGRANASAYCASKAGVIGLTRSWARELAPRILVNAVAPGPIDTPMLDFAARTPEEQAIETDLPLGRIGRPEEIAAAIVFLASPGASYITGQCLGVNGGAAMT
jgi:3-oxoacyl-[acyl-carrier protein] reductase